MPWRRGRPLHSWPLSLKHRQVAGFPVTCVSRGEGASSSLAPKVIQKGPRKESVAPECTDHRLLAGRCSAAMLLWVLSVQHSAKGVMRRGGGKDQVRSHRAPGREKLAAGNLYPQGPWLCTAETALLLQGAWAQRGGTCVISVVKSWWGWECGQQ